MAADAHEVHCGSITLFILIAYFTWLSYLPCINWRIDGWLGLRIYGPHGNTGYDWSLPDNGGFCDWGSAYLGGCLDAHGLLRVFGINGIDD